MNFACETMKTLSSLYYFLVGKRENAEMITWILNYLASQWCGAKPLSLMAKVDQL
jgi:hypothetical protein